MNTVKNKQRVAKLIMKTGLNNVVHIVHSCQQNCSTLQLIVQILIIMNNVHGQQIISSILLYCRLNFLGFYLSGVYMHDRGLKFRKGPGNEVVFLYLQYPYSMLGESDSTDQTYKNLSECQRMRIFRVKPIFHLANLFARADKKVGTVPTCSRRFFSPASFN